MPSQGRSVARDKWFETLDTPEQALQYGGINGESTIPGMPAPVGEHGTKRLGLHSEPVAVMLRDAVTIDTAVRLTGISRLTLQRAAHEGRLPHVKLGPGNAPYLVRIRDVVIYLATMWGDKRARRELTDTNEFFGFPEWLVNYLSDGWPTGEAFTPGKWRGGLVKINRGGRPKRVRGVSQSPSPEAEKGGPPESNHSPAAPPAAPAVPAAAPPQPTPDRTRLPKWHPQWQRPAETTGG